MSARRSLLVGLLGLVAATSGCGIHFPLFHDIKGSGKIVDEAREVAAFSKLELHGSVEASYEPADVPSVTISCDENLLPLILTETEDGRLVIRLQDNTSISPTKGIFATVKGPNVDELVAHGACTLNAKVAPGEKLGLQAHGASKIAVEGAQCKAMEVEAHGHSKVKVSGSTETVSMSAHGASAVDGATLDAGVAKVNVAGASSADVAAREVEGEASGASHVTVIGTPTRRDVKTSGASSVETRAR